MSLFESGSPRWTARMLSVFRIVVGLLFLCHGTQKLFGFPPSANPMPPFSLASQIGIAGILEAFGGALIVLGLFTRPVAFVLAGEMAVAYHLAHFPRGSFPINNGGELALLYCFSFLYLLFAGGGAWSVDAMIARSRHGAPPGEAPRQRIDTAA